MIRSTLHGAVGANEGQVPPLNASEVRRLRAYCSTLDRRPKDEDAFVQALTNAAYNMRSFSAQAAANTKKSRSENLAMIYREIVSSGNSATRPSLRNSELIQWLKRNGHENSPEIDIIKAARRKLREIKVGRGDRPHHYLDYCGWQVSEAYITHTGSPPTVVPSGDFVRLLGEVFSVATGKARIDVHRIAERALKGTFNHNGEGPIFTPFDLVETGGN